MSYPEITDPNFYQKILNKKEFNENKIENVLKNIYYLEPQQRFLANYLDPKTPYKKILVYHEVGTGKTITSIAVAESNIAKYSNIKILVFCKNPTIIENYQQNLKKVQILKHPENYIFLTYKSLSEYTKSFPEKSVVIIDEIHNLVSDNLSETLKTCIDNSGDFKLVLLSGTPMYDHVSQIFDILNFVVPIDLRVDSKAQGLFNKEVLTPAGKEYLKIMAKGVVSFLKIDSKTFAKQKNIDLYLEMEAFQKKGYLEINNKKQTLYLNEVAASLIVYPNYISHVKEISGDFLKIENVKYHSIKLYTLYQQLKSNSGKSIVFSNYIVNSTGINLIKLFFDVNKISYILISENMKESKFDQIKKFNNSKNNSEILLSSNIISEGISTKDVYNIHIIDLHWNDSRLQQVIGRAIRKNSHSKTNVTVKIFKYICIIPGHRTIDEYKYAISNSKKIGIEEAKNILNQVAVDCWLNKSRNGTIECIYEPVSKELSLDTTTFKIDPLKYAFIKDKITSLFLKINYLKLETIKQKVNLFQDKFSNEEIEQTLSNLNYSEIIGPNNLPGFLIRKGKYLIFNSKNTIFFSNINEKCLEINFKQKDNKIILEKKIKKENTIKKTKISIDFFQKNEEYINDIFAHTYNKYGEDDSELRIIDLTEIDPLEEDIRKISIGKKISILSKSELINTSKKLNLDISSLKNKEIVELIKNYFINNNFVFKK